MPFLTPARLTSGINITQFTNKAMKIYHKIMMAVAIMVCMAVVAAFTTASTIMLYSIAYA